MALRMTWLGQSGLLLEGGGRVVLVDPWTSNHPDRAKPPPVVRFWPARIDLLLITHGHGDHLDLAGIARLSRAAVISEIVVPKPHVEAVAAELPDIVCVGARPGETLDRFGGVTVLPAWHGVAAADGYDPMIGPDGTSPHVGYAFSLGGTGAYVSGDTLAHPSLVDAVKEIGPNLVFLPVNGRDPAREARGILGNMTSREAVDFAVSVGAHTLVPLHYDAVIGNTSDVGEVARAAQGQPLHVVIPARAIPFTFEGNPT
jgi:L-ascorbate 6-phosphate lactonase